MARSKKINTDKGKLAGISAKIPEDKKEVAADLHKQLIFMAESLDELIFNVKENGPVTLFEQGKQKMIIENPAMKSYNTTIQRYSLIYKQLLDLLPKEEPKMENDDFDDFVNKRDGLM